MHDIRRQVYAKYLAALASTDSGPQLLAIAEETRVDAVKVRAVRVKHSVLALSYEVQLVAPKVVSEAAVATYQELRKMRNAIRGVHLEVGNVADSDGIDSDEWVAVHLPYIKAMKNLRNAMHADVQRN